MILVDANLLLYAHDTESRHHEAALRWWRECLANEPFVGLAWETVGAFLRVTTHRSVMRRPLSPEEASQIVDQWLGCAAVHPVTPGPRHWEILRSLLAEAQVTGALVTDARLAALAIEHGLRVATHDLDFRRFEGLRVVYPLA